MGIFDFLKKKKKPDTKASEGLEVDLDSDLPVHEKFVDERGLRETKDKKKKEE